MMIIEPVGAAASVLWLLVYQGQDLFSLIGNSESLQSKRNRLKNQSIMLLNQNQFTADEDLDLTMLCGMF